MTTIENAKTNNNDGAYVDVMAAKAYLVFCGFDATPNEVLSVVETNKSISSDLVDVLPQADAWLNQLRA